MYEPRTRLYQASVRNQEISKSIEQSRLHLDEVLNKDFLDPISKYLGQFKEIKTRIEERNNRKVDMDRYGREVRSLQEKATNQVKVKAAEQKYDAATTNYQNLNDELLRDMPNLYEDRIPFFDPLFATYTVGVAEYYKQSSQATSEMISLVSGIDRQSVHSHQKVITPTESSSAGFKATVGSGMSGSSYKSNSDSNASDYSNASAPPLTQSSKPMKTSTHQAKALYDFNPGESNELGFKLGDILTIHKMQGDWWEGELNGNRGLLPSNYVQLMS